VRYDLAVTDPAWLDQLNLLPVGIHPHAFLFAGKPLERLSRRFLLYSDEEQ
jgi:hypothetical protein